MSRTFLRRLAGERGQATSESAVLLVTAMLATFGGGAYLMASHPAWLNALSIHIHSFYYLLSLPFP